MILLLVIVLTTVGYLLHDTPHKVPSRPKSKDFGAIKSYKLNSLVSSSRPSKNKEQVLILTPLNKFRGKYWQNLLDLTYPRDLVELGFIVPANAQGDQALKLLDDAVKKVQTGPVSSRFAKVSIIRQDTPSLDSQTDVHAFSVQKRQRAYMSLARNTLLLTSIGPKTSWILWLDSDVVETPPTLIQDLASHDKPIIVANSFQRYVDPKKGPSIRPYGFNSWRDSEKTLDMVHHMLDEDIIVEGYPEMKTHRVVMADMYDDTTDPRTQISLDGVGGAALLVKAEVHRDGAMFPPFLFYHLMESEGFAKMARRLGYQPCGLPNYLVFHE